MRRDTKKTDKIVNRLKRYSIPGAKEGMAKYGINTDFALGVSIPNIRNIGEEIGKEHRLALELWKTKIHEARILATMIDDPKAVTEKQMEDWVSSFNSWDLCDQCCSNLFDKTDFAYKKAVSWSKKSREFTKRAGFVLMAVLAVHDKKAKDEEFIKFLHIIKKESLDDRNFVKKAVNWALRQIGKKNINLNKTAIKTAEEIQKIDSKSSRWIASDALKELQSKSVQKRFNK